MSKALLVAFACLLWPIPETFASPEELVAAFFGPSGIEDKSALYTGEMLGFMEHPTLGEQLPEGASFETRPLFSSDSRVVLGVTLSANGHTQDWYAFIARVEEQWRLEAVRTLALTTVAMMAVSELEQKRTLDSEEEWMLHNLRLTLTSDAGLAEFFRAHKTKLNKIVELFSSEQPAAEEVARELHISTIDRLDDGSVALVIGGMVDNTVGFLWVPPGATAPEASPESYILIEQLSERWFLFKTT